jgi:hypothetical protein
MKLFHIRVEQVKPIFSAYEKSPFGIFFHAMNEIVSDGKLIVLPFLKDFERFAVKTVEPVACSKPDKTFAVLHDCPHAVMRQTVFYLITPEVKCFDREDKYMQP